MKFYEQFLWTNIGEKLRWGGVRSLNTPLLSWQNRAVGFGVHFRGIGKKSGGGGGLKSQNAPLLLSGFNRDVRFREQFRGIGK